MTQKQGRAPKKLIFFTDFWRFVRTHKIISSLWLSLLILPVLTVGIFNYIQYQQKFSKDDFERLATMAETVLHQTSGQQVITSKTCSYERPGEFDDLHLFCRVQEVTYLKYIDNSQAISTAKLFGKNIGGLFGSQSLNFSTFYTRPVNGYGVSVIALKNPFPTKHCNFYIDTNRNAMDVLNFPPKKAGNLIALSFECSAESRGEYYPVTYRQG